MNAMLLKYVLRVLYATAVLFAMAVAWIYAASEHRLRTTYPVAFSSSAPDPALVARGRVLAYSRGCADCHGDDFAGKIVLDEMPFARIVGTDLRPSPGESDIRRHERFHRALHHGVTADARPLLMMPSTSFAKLSAQEIEALAAYFGTLPPARGALPRSALGPVGRMLLVAGKLEGFLSAEKIDHGKPILATPPTEGTLAYGRHAAQLCSGCHRADFGGGRMDHGGPDAPPASNLTVHALGLSDWTEADFVRAMRTGKRPDGSDIDGRFMPWRAVGHADDEELRAIWRFLRTLPPVSRDARGAH